ncbi:MAG: hypothetical protein ACQEQV_03515 [Fibrobacterota bacterium]
MEMIYLLDLSLFITLLVIANLSRRIGEAMMIPPIYKTYYYLCGCIVFASIIDIFIKGLPGMEGIHLGTNIIRAAASLIALPVSFRYWSWLLKEDMRG